MDFTGVPDSTVGAITDVDITDEGFIGDPALNGNASSKGTKDSSTAAFETAVAALKDTRDSSTVVFEMAIVAFTAGGGNWVGMAPGAGQSLTAEKTKIIISNRRQNSTTTRSFS